MFTKTKIALSIAIVLGTAFTASAATKNDKIAVRHSGLYAHHMVLPTASASNPDDPAHTGGGSLGYNQNLYNN